MEEEAERWGEKSEKIKEVRSKEDDGGELHVYDVTNSGSEKTNNTVIRVNRVFKDRIGLGGVFHSAVLVYVEEEWSFGFCENGTGVLSCPRGKNPMYTYCECIILGERNCSILKVDSILRKLSQEWPGDSYDLFSKICNHFCDDFCERLGVPKLPGWVNRFANAGDAAMVVAENTAFNQAKTEIVTATKVAYRFLADLASNSNSSATPESPGNSQTEAPLDSKVLGLETSYLGAKPSGCSSEVSEGDNDTLPPQKQKSMEQHQLSSKHNI